MPLQVVTLTGAGVLLGVGLARTCTTGKASRLRETVKSIVEIDRVPCCNYGRRCQVLILQAADPDDATQKPGAECQFRLPLPLGRHVAHCLAARARSHIRLLGSRLAQREVAWGCAFRNACFFRMLHRGGSYLRSVLTNVQWRCSKVIWASTGGAHVRTLLRRKL